MKLIAAAALAVGLLGALPSVAFAESCYDLWYARNSIYDSYGLCFQTSLGKRTFDNSDCYTRNPHLSRQDQAIVAHIQAEERARDCNVN
jgi:hypothetical protein